MLELWWRVALFAYTATTIKITQFFGLAILAVLASADGADYLLTRARRTRHRQHIVLLSGDEEYRSDLRNWPKSLPTARFQCTLFAINPADGDQPGTRTIRRRQKP